MKADNSGSAVSGRKRRPEGRIGLRARQDRPGAVLRQRDGLQNQAAGGVYQPRAAHQGAVLQVREGELTMEWLFKNFGKLFVAWFLFIALMAVAVLAGVAFVVYKLMVHFGVL